jgi:beta-xylosidase
MITKLFSLIGAVVITVCVLVALVFTSSATAATKTSSSVNWTDSFSSDTLDGRWSWIREDVTSWSLTAQPGFLRLITQETFSTVDNLLVQNAPSGDYEILTRVLFEPTEDFQIAGLLMYQDDNNWLVLGRAFCNPIQAICVGNGIYFDYLEDGVFSNNNFSMTTTVLDEAYLKVVRHENVYTGYVSTDGTNWTFVGEQTITISPTKIGIKASNQTQGATEIPADFDFFTLIDHSKYLYLPIILK